MKYCYPAFPGHKFGPFKIGSHGLGNLMLIWARAYIYAHSHGHKLVWPEWSQIHIGSWMRWERDKRLYGKLFIRPSEIEHQNVFDKNLQVFGERELDEFEHYSDDAVLKFEGIEVGFTPLLGNQDLLWRALCQMSRRDLQALRDSGNGYIGFCVRLGDFKNAGWSTPISWFVERLKELRFHQPEQKVWVFSDGSNEELQPLFEDKLVTRAPSWKNPLESIAQMSGTSAMIATGGSTFYRWGAFLGQVPVIAHAHDQWHVKIWSELSPCGKAYTIGQRPTSCDWADLLTYKKNSII